MWDIQRREKAGWAGNTEFVYGLQSAVIKSMAFGRWAMAFLELCPLSLCQTIKKETALSHFSVLPSPGWRYTALLNIEQGLQKCASSVDGLQSTVHLTTVSLSQHSGFYGVSWTLRSKQLPGFHWYGHPHQISVQAGVSFCCQPELPD